MEAEKVNIDKHRQMRDKHTSYKYMYENFLEMICVDISSTIKKMFRKRCGKLRTTIIL